MMILMMIFFFRFVVLVFLCFCPPSPCWLIFSSSTAHRRRPRFGAPPNVKLTQKKILQTVKERPRNVFLCILIRNFCNESYIELEEKRSDFQLVMDFDNNFHVWSPFDFVARLSVKRIAKDGCALDVLDYAIISCRHLQFLSFEGFKDESESRLKYQIELYRGANYYEVESVQSPW